MARAGIIYVAVVGAALALGGCRPGARAPAESPARTEDMSQPPVEVVLTAVPGKVEFDKDILLSIRVAAPESVAVEMPSVDDRVEGFSVSGSYDEDPYTRDGKTVRERKVRLTPVLAARHRLAPMAVQYTDRGARPPRSAWFATRPVVFEVVLPTDGRPPSDISGLPSPVWITPPFRTVVVYLLVLAAALAVAWGLWYAAGRVRRQIRLMRMSPRDRALEELTELLARDLISRQLVKEFYIELTMVVRRYVERAHKVRAPEQTTEEFMAAVSNDPRFSHETVRRLRAFLESADLVKFAGYRPVPETIDRAVGTAREYIVSDAEEHERAAEAKAGEVRP